MRFIENGPSIPDELLNARDEGRVVFICGSGVSLARAGLPDFFGLAEDVIGELGVSDDSDASKMLRAARELGKKLDVILPLLTKIARPFGLHLHVSDKKAEEIAAKHPKVLLKLLYSVLSDDVSEWPYGTVSILEKIGLSDSTIRSDAQFQELNRRWNAR